MTIKQLGGVFGRNPEFNSVEANSVEANDLTVSSGQAIFAVSGDDIVLSGGSPSFTITDITGPYNHIIQAVNAELRIESADDLRIETADQQRMRIDGTTGDVTVYKNLVIGTSGKGIDFSATAGTGTSELLDDYEEGVWTPVLSDASSGGNLGSATINKANYTKVGRSVTLSASLSDIVTTGMGSSLSLYIQGLPFTSASSNSSFGVVKIDSVALQGGRTSAVCEVSDSDAWLRFWAIGDAIADTPIDCGDITSGSSDIFFTINYHV